MEPAKPPAEASESPATEPTGFAPLALDGAALEPLLASARSYVADARAPSTRKAYARDFAAFEAWCRETAGCEPTPATPALAALYLAALADEGLKVSTIERAYAAIVFAQRAQGIDWPKAPTVVRETIAGIRRRLGVAPQKKAALSPEELRHLVSTLERMGLRGVRDRAVLTMGWAGAFRRSELVALTLGDVERADEGLILHVRRSKTDQEGLGAAVGIVLAGSSAVCPVRAYEAWIEASGLTSGPVFRRIVKGEVGPEPLGAAEVSRILKRAARAADLDPSRVAAHSLRAGFMTTAARRGKSLPAIMLHSRHRCAEVAMGYVRTATVFDDNASSGLL